MKPTMSTVFLFLELLALATVNFSFCSRSASLHCIESERQALLSFKQDLKDPSNRLASWSAGDGDCCKWDGVVCDNLTSHVLELHLENTLSSYYVFKYEAGSRSSLGGKINPSLLDLKDLVYFNLNKNDFEGTQIPRFIGSMRKLKYLDLSAAGFVGMIPHQLGNLSNLRYLDLSAKDQGGLYVENLFWLSGLPMLEHLDLSKVNLNETSDSLLVTSDLPVLEVLILSGCQLHHFPPLPIGNFSSLTILDLSDNQLGNSIPSWIFGLSNLVSLSLSTNNFEGPIPDGLQNLTSLRDLDLSLNFFNSSIPNWLYKFSHLEHLYLDVQCMSLDELQGRIPRSIGTLCNLKTLSLVCVKVNQTISEVLDILSGCASDKLESLDLHHGQLFGHLTNQLGKFKNLVSLDLSNNSISGPVPPSLGELLSLDYVDLSYNKFDGTISEIHFANLTKLFYFYAAENSLTLKVSPNWIPPFQLHVLGLRSWSLGPQFPSWLYSQKKLVDLDISNSRIVDTISSRFWKFLSQISYSNLSHNQIFGEIPNLSELSKLIVLDLSSNNFSGPLPPLSPHVLELDLSNNNLSGSIFEFLCFQTVNMSKQTQILKLNDNFLSGKLPDCWVNWPYLKLINLGNNKFTGNLPTSLGNLSFLESLNLQKNNLFGTISASLKTINLKVLDISENEFVGKVPTWIGESFSRMIILNLRSNKFHGVLPMELCRLSSLQILDLAYNNLSGTVPRCFNNFTAMMMMKYSMGNSIHYSASGLGTFSEDASLVVKGKMVEYSSILNLVRIIDLSKNNFFGEIPIEVTNLEALQSLNLSHNFLTGRIPKTIGAMTSIESIDFSANQLSGEIPNSVSNLTFLSYLNLSNNNLVGRIPSSTQLQSLDASCFIGNELCGPPLPKDCTVTASVPKHEKGGQDGNKHEVNWFYVSMALGFVVGFWSVMGPLFVNRRWREKSMWNEDDGPV